MEFDELLVAVAEELEVETMLVEEGELVTTVEVEEEGVDVVLGVDDVVFVELVARNTPATATTMMMTTTTTIATALEIALIFLLKVMTGRSLSVVQSVFMGFAILRNSAL